jgi:addiction module RelB/DinJ family antitoxin
MTKTMINIKADKEVKEQAQQIAEELGLTLSAIVNASLKQFIRERKVEFSTAPRMTPYLEKIVGEARTDWKAGKNFSGPFTDADSIMRHLSR